MPVPVVLDADVVEVCVPVLVLVTVWDEPCVCVLAD